MSDSDLLVEEEAIEAPSANYVKAISEIESRCKKSNIEFTRLEDEDGVPYIRLWISSGKDKRAIFIGGLDKATHFLSINFENRVFISGYDAICSYEEGTIEASIGNLTSMPSSYMSQIINRNTNGPGNDTLEILPPESSIGQPILQIGPPSNELNIFLGSSYRRFSLKISGLSVSRNDAAAQILTRYSNSLFFQIDLAYNVSFILDRERRRRIVAKNSSREIHRPSINYPRFEYDTSAMSLYWYGRTARGMPLLQFLAFYQVLEFYYPRFSNVEARKKISVLLKDPMFRIDRDEHIDKLLSAIIANRAGGIGDERSQLRSVINHCIDADALREFLEGDVDREKHLSGKSAKQKYPKLSFHNKSIDLRNDISDRIYAIRCSIVHTKNDTKGGEADMILPFSSDADAIRFDIDVVQFLAKSVLLATSSSL